MTRFMFMLVLCCVPITVAVGCGAGDDDIGQITDDGGGGGEVGGGGADGGGGAVGGGAQTGLIFAKAPLDLKGQPFVGDFFTGKHRTEFTLDYTLVCEGKNECEISVDGEIQIEFRCPKHLFVPMVVEGNASTKTDVRWDTPGDWGLAPNGVYRREQDQNEVEVTTVVQQGQVLLIVDGGEIGAVDGISFTWTSEQGTKYTGTISDDLRQITYHGVLSSGNKEWDTELTLVE